jgi:hypothetical protein
MFDYNWILSRVYIDSFGQKKTSDGVNSKLKIKKEANFNRNEFKIVYFILMLVTRALF